MLALSVTAELTLHSGENILDFSKWFTPNFFTGFEQISQLTPRTNGDLNPQLPPLSFRHWLFAVPLNQLLAQFFADTQIHIPYITLAIAQLV